MTGFKPSRSGAAPGSSSESRSNPSPSAGKSFGGSPRRNGAGAKGAFGDSMSVVWQVARRPWMWVALPVSFIAFFVLLSSGANLLFKTATGEQNSLPVTADGIVSGSAYGVRSLFGATADQVRQGAQNIPTENVYNRPLVKQSPAPADSEPVQPDVQ